MPNKPQVQTITPNTKGTPADSTLADREKLRAMAEAMPSKARGDFEKNRARAEAMPTDERSIFEQALADAERRRIERQMGW